MSAYQDKNSPVIYAKRALDKASMTILESMFDQTVSADIDDIQKVKKYKAYFKRYFFYKTFLHPFELFFTMLFFGRGSKSYQKRRDYYNKIKAYYNQLKLMEWA